MDVSDKDVVLMNIYLKNVYHISHNLMIRFSNVLFLCVVENISSFYMLCRNFLVGKPFYNESKIEMKNIEIQFYI